jgi:hypothetical protein
LNPTPNPLFQSNGVQTSPICLRFGLFRPLNPPILGDFENLVPSILGEFENLVPSILGDFENLVPSILGDFENLVSSILGDFENKILFPQFWGLGGDSITCVYTVALPERAMI